jgi:hypothetical protein
MGIADVRWGMVCHAFRNAASGGYVERDPSCGTATLLGVLAWGLHDIGMGLSRPEHAEYL